MLNELLIIFGIILIGYGITRIVNSKFPETYKKSSLYAMLNLDSDVHSSRELLMLRGLLGIVLGIGMIFVGINFQFGEQVTVFLEVDNNDDLIEATIFDYQDDAVLVENVSNLDLELELDVCGQTEENAYYDSISYEGKLESGNSLEIPLYVRLNCMENYNCTKPSTIGCKNIKIESGEYTFEQEDFSIDSTS